MALILPWKIKPLETGTPPKKTLEPKDSKEKQALKTK
jgi:hypothetical protein